MHDASFRAFSVLMPGLTKGDEVRLYDNPSTPQDEAAQCSLTLDSISDCNPKEQLHEHLTRHTDAGVLTEACRRPLPRGVQLHKCGHHFSALPFLVHVMTTSFRCPICRCGSGREINLDKTCPRLPPALWDVLCSGAKAMRLETRREQEQEDRQAILQDLELDLQDLPITELVADVLTFVVSFQIRSAARIDLCMIELRHVKDMVYASEETLADDAPVVVTNGAYPVSRPVSRMLRQSSWYSFKLSVGINGMLSDIFDSNRLEFPHTRATSQEFAMGTPGERFVMRFESTPYDGENMLKRLEFHSTAASVRRLVYLVPVLAESEPA